MGWRKRIARRLDWLYRDHTELSFCPTCWATVWMPHKRLHQQWHESLDQMTDQKVDEALQRLQDGGYIPT